MIQVAEAVDRERPSPSQLDDRRGARRRSSRRTNVPSMRSNPTSAVQCHPRQAREHRAPAQPRSPDAEQVEWALRAQVPARGEKWSINMLSSAIVRIVDFCAQRRSQVLIVGTVLASMDATYDVARFSTTTDTEVLPQQQQT